MGWFVDRFRRSFGRAVGRSVELMGRSAIRSLFRVFDRMVVSSVSSNGRTVGCSVKVMDRSAIRSLFRLFDRIVVRFGRSVIELLFRLFDYSVG